MSKNGSNNMVNSYDNADVKGTSSDTSLVPISSGELISAANASGKPLSVPVPFQNNIVLIENTRIAGTLHIRNIDAIVKELKIGSELRFEREKNNLSDVWAIKVFAGKDRIGYVSADCNEVLARLMDAGKSLKGKLNSKEKSGNWNKLHMEIRLED